MRTPPAEDTETATAAGLNPLDAAGFLSFSTMSWMTPVMWSMSRKQLDPSTLSGSPLEGADVNGDRLQQLWEQEVCAVGLQKASLIRVLLRFQGNRLLLVVAIAVVFIVALFVSSGIMVNEILLYIHKPESFSVWGGLGLCLGLAFMDFIRISSLGLCWAIGIRTGIRMKTGFCMLGFRKIITLRTHSEVSVGQMVNILTSDSYKLLDAVFWFPTLLPCPLLLIACAVYSCHILDYTALIGFFIFIVFIVLQLLSARLINRFQTLAGDITDIRVRSIDEILSCIKLIKMYAWEESFRRRVTDIRTLERNMLEKAALIQNLSSTISPLVPIIAIMVTYMVHTWLGLPLSTSTAFPFVTLLNSVRYILSVLPSCVGYLAEAAVSVKRLKRLLLTENTEPYIIHGTGSPSAVVVMENATLSWTKPTPHLVTEDRDNLVSEDRAAEGTPVLRNVSFTLHKGKLLAVCGAVGNGKTSLICSLLEQLNLQQGSVSVQGSMAYAAQQAWIFYGTLQDNILMGEPLDHSRYKRVLSCCCLEEDLNILPHGDQTLLGEEGVNLSGGQKQRVSLARAVYSDRDIFLLDDPLSAVDAHVGKHIFEQCIKGELQGKSIILVTHQLQYLEFCDEVLVLKDGAVQETGSHVELMKAGRHYADIITNHVAMEPDVIERVAMELNSGAPKPLRQSLEAPLKEEVNGHLNGGIINPAFNMSDETTDAFKPFNMSDETTDAFKPSEQKNEATLITWKTLQQYCHAAGGLCVSIFVVLCFVVLTANGTLGYWGLSYVLEQGHGTANVTSSERDDVSLNPDLPFYRLVAVVMMSSLLLVFIVKCVFFVRVSLNAASTLHNNLLSNILARPMSFFDSIPTGRILNCFSSCQSEVDAAVPFHVNVQLMFSLLAVCSLLVSAATFPYMVLPAGGLLLLLVLVFSLFLRNICTLKKMEDVSRSPCISLCTSIVRGLGSIHAYGKTHTYTERFKVLSDTNSTHLLLFNFGLYWLSHVMGCLCVVMTLIVSLLVVFVSNDVCSPPMKALSLNFILQLSANFQYLLLSMISVEARFISVERLLEYITGSEELEGGQREVKPVPEDWPQTGVITFLDYKMRYRQNLPFVLNGLHLHIRAGEKIGIVGRTGSGKSSLAVALFRLVEPAAGSVLIDGVDITSISLSNLRNKLSIIPQDPILFTGTIRSNLDPVNRHSDEEIWAALEKTYMKDAIWGLEGKLQAELVDNGGNFSLGQKQLISLSRALLRDSKIILLDEATASIDAETDSLIQITIREAFRDSTVLTIAHRIHTVLQADRILVLNQGQVVEFDHPDVLKQRPDSLFASLLSASNTVAS
ncbi:multidrug resistance-associated protein 9 [Etheostoma spectabile]|uniref:multidrug resistance-associated protein 9 n=1 Tax=Etheostoma spectabile TaxID=54343 RepID=UPI0013AFDD1A|nr:multidrug resistance-associated protein 9-like [Etheostoma spectabile]